MDWIRHIFEIYLLAFLLLIHTSLLFCKPDSCAFDATSVLKALPPGAIATITKMLATVPISLPNLQLIAHFLLVGDALLLVGLFFNVFGKIIRFILSTIVLTFTICFVIYVLSMMSDAPALVAFRH
jgi:hypothetical protein